MPDGRTIRLGKQPRRFLEDINDNFLTQVILEMLRECVLLNLILTGKSLI